MKSRYLPIRRPICNIRGKHPLLIKGVKHVKKQTGIACISTLIYDALYDEYCCIHCGWRADSANVEMALMTAQFFGGEITL